MTLALWIVQNVAQTWGGYGSFCYEQAIWDGRRFVYTGRMIVVCDWKCYLGL